MSGLAEYLIELWWLWLPAVCVPAAVLALAVAILDRLFVRWAPPRWVSPQLLGWLWMLVIIRLFLPPSLTSPWGLPLNSSRLPSAAVSGTGNDHGALFWIWLAGCLSVAAAVIWRYRRIHRDWRTGLSEAPPWINQAAAKAAAMLGMHAVPAVALRASASSPALVGLLRPVIVVPSELADRLTPRQIEHVMLHELAHLRRRDPWWMALLLVVRGLFWFHPLVWLACRRMSTLREIACDRMASAAAGSDPDAYRRTLLECASWALAPLPAPGLPLLGQGGQLLARLEWLQRSPSAPGRHHALAGIPLGCLLLIVSLPRSSLIPDLPAAVPLQLTLADSELAERPPGCLVLRYQVLGMLAQQEQAGP